MKRIKDTYLSPKVEKELQNRLRRIEGHTRGIQQMLAQHKDCETLLIQISAIKSAINQVAIKLLENHMETCVSECVQKGKGIAALNKLKSALSKVLK